MTDSCMRKAILLSVMILFLVSMNACATSGGSIGMGWGNGTGHGSAPPPHNSNIELKGKKNGPPAHAPAHGYRAKHNYRYYPDACVYYEAARGAYFYLDNGNWRMSVSLPGSIQLDSTYVSLELDTDAPYRYNHEHKAKYPPGKMKHKNKKKGKKWS